MDNYLSSLLPKGIGDAFRQYVRDAFGGALNAEVKPQDTLDAAALSLTPVPVVGDVAGLLADGYRYATDPSSRTPLNYGLSALGALPFVPAMGGMTKLGNSVNKESPIRLISSQRFLDQDIVNDKIRKKDFSVKVSPVFELPDTGEKVRVVQDGHHALSAALESGNKPNILEQSVTQNDRIGLLNQGQIDDFLNASYHDSPWYYLDNGIDIW